MGLHVYSLYIRLRCVSQTLTLNKGPAWINLYIDRDTNGGVHANSVCSSFNRVEWMFDNSQVSISRQTLLFELMTAAVQLVQDSDPVLDRKTQRSLCQRPQGCINIPEERTQRNVCRRETGASSQLVCSQSLQIWNPQAETWGFSQNFTFPVFSQTQLMHHVTKWPSVYCSLMFFLFFSS